MFQISKELETTYELIKSKYKRYKTLVAIGRLTILCGIFLLVIFFAIAGSGPIWEQSFVAQFILIVTAALLVATFVLTQFTGVFSLEKRAFLKLYQASKLLERFSSLSGFDAQKNQNLRE